MCKEPASNSLLVLLALVAAAGNTALAQEQGKQMPLRGFPQASLTVFPVTYTITGPVEKYRKFYDGMMGAAGKHLFDVTDTLDLLLAGEGYDKSEVTDTAFRFPEGRSGREFAEGKAAREQRAAVFGEFVRTQKLKTDYALCVEMTLHLEQSWQDVYAVIVDATGVVAWEDSLRPGDPEFDARMASGGPEAACGLVCARLTPVMGLGTLPKPELSEERKQALASIRAAEPATKPERAAMSQRLAAMKQAGASASVTIYPTRVAGDHTDRDSAVRLGTLLGSARLCKATAANTSPLLKGGGWPNEAKVLWIFANAARDYARENPPDNGYILFADYWFAPDGQVWAVHFVVCDQAGDWVLVDLQNSHQDDFQRIAPKTLADCDRLVLERLKAHLASAQAMGDEAPRAAEPRK